MADDVEIKAGKPEIEIKDEKREASDDDREREERYRREISNPLRVTD